MNLHVLSQGCEEIERMVRFRDWLRGNEADRELYARTKRKLARGEWKTVPDYADAKTWRDCGDYGSLRRLNPSDLSPEDYSFSAAFN